VHSEVILTVPCGYYGGYALGELDADQDISTLSIQRA
jgi:hypothetical protein